MEKKESHITILFETSGKSYDELVKFQQQALDKLSDWAEMLLENE